MIIQDIRENKKYIGKLYHKDHDREQEEMILSVIQKDPDFGSYFIKKVGETVEYDGKKFMIFEQGICDLKTFFLHKYRQSEKNEFKKLDTKELRYIYRFLVKSLEFLWKYGIAHCDIKLQNIVIIQRDTNPDLIPEDYFEIRLIDYGSFTVIDKDKFNRHLDRTLYKPL